MKQQTRKRLARGAMLLALAFAPAARADYAFFPNGYDPANVSYSATSGGTLDTLETGTSVAATTAFGFEGRWREWLATLGTALRSDKLSGLIIIFK